MSNTGRGLLFAILIHCTACVSVQFGPPGAVAAKNIHLVAPSEPFEKFDVQDVDAAWKSRANGNSISYRTACNDPAEGEIKSIQQMIVDGLDASTVETSDVTQFNGREALHSVVQGKLDGISTKIEFMIFKKNNCAYTITYVALPKNFQSDHSVFKKFLSEFVAP